MTERVYNNVYSRRMADGSIKTYNYERTIKLKGRKTLPEELTNEIKLKYSYGVTKRRLASDFKLSIFKINRIVDGLDEKHVVEGQEDVDV